MILHQYIYTIAVVINIPPSISLFSDDGSIDSGDIAGESVKGDISKAYRIALRAAWVACTVLCGLNSYLSLVVPKISI